MEKDKFKWELPKLPARDEVCSGDIRKVLLEVTVVCEYSNEIPDEIDEEGEILSYKEGYIMRPIPNQKFLYRGERTQFIAQAFLKK